MVQIYSVFIQKTMKTLIRKKKILNDWYEFIIIDEKSKKIKKEIGCKNFNEIAPNLMSIRIKLNKIELKTNKEIEYENEFIINRNNEILIEGILKIFKVGNDCSFHILELDGLNKTWKKFIRSKSDRIFLIMDNNGNIINGPTTKIIKYIPCVDEVVIGKDIFSSNRGNKDTFSLNRDNNDKYIYGGFKHPRDGDTLTELIPDNTYILTQGNRKGLLYGQAIWYDKEKLWNKYANIGLFPLNCDSIIGKETFIPDTFILKLDDKFSFYKVERNVGCINTLSERRYKEIKELQLHNNYLNLAIGFICINDNNRIDFFRGSEGWDLGDNFISLETSSEEEAMSKILTIIGNNECSAKSSYYYSYGDIRECLEMQYKGLGKEEKKK